MIILIKIWFTFLLFLTVNGKANITSLFRSFGKEFSGSRDDCSKPVSDCQPLQNILINSTCINIKLPYEYTKENTKDILPLDYWSPIKAIPRCWTNLQALLCSLKYPECSIINSESFIKKPTREICQVTRRECSLLIVKNNNEINKSNDETTSPNQINSIVERTPFFLDCDKYASKCILDKRMSHNSNLYSCQWPMVKTYLPALWIEGFDGCSFTCKTPFFNHEEYRVTEFVFGIVGLIFLFLNVLVLITFLLHQRQHSNYKWHPMLLHLFIIHFYMLIACFGWIMQLVPGIGHSIVCRSDGALQIREPKVRIGESIWCVVVFSLVYFPLFASSLTSLSFFYSILSVVSQYSRCWTQHHRIGTQENVNNTTNRGKIPFLAKKFRFSLRKNDKSNIFNVQSSPMIDFKQDKDEVKFSGIENSGDSINSRNHSLSTQLFVVLISTSFLIISLTVGEIKGDPVSGICFVANDAMIVRVCLSLLPLTVILVATSIIMNMTISHFRVIQKHLNLYASNQQKIHSKRMNETATFYIFILLFLWMFWGFSVYTHSYIFTNEKLWYLALKNQFLCNLRHALLPGLSLLNIKSELMTCPLEIKPKINVFILHSISYFSINIIFVLCALFNKHFIVVWQNELKKLCARERSKNSANIESNKSQPNGAPVPEKLYFGLQNRTLLDSVWNPGIFVYLVYKNKNNAVDKDNINNTNEDRTTTLGSTENSSASYCIYQQDGSLRSCVSMPPINVVRPQNACQCSQYLSHKSEICPTLENVLKGTQNYIGQNSVRRSNSYAGRACIVANSPIGNVSNPKSYYHSGQVNRQNLFCKDSLQNNSFVGHSGINHLSCSNSNCFQNRHPNFSEKSYCPPLNGCISLNHLTVRRNTLDNTSSKYNKSLRRFSVNFDRKNEKGVSSKSTLNRRKRTARYSVSPRSLSKTFNNQSTGRGRLADPSSRNSSSFSAESYNSYNLMSQQIGGRWRDICRTRMTLHDVMIWAKAASQNHVPIHGICHNQLCNYSLSIDNCSHSNGTFGSKLLAQNKQFPGNILLPANYQNTNLSLNAFKISDKTQKDCSLTKAQVPTEKDIVTSETVNYKASINSNDSSDKFDSEDEIVSVESSVKSAAAGSEEFCSDDEVISLINSENQ